MLLNQSLLAISAVLLSCSQLAVAQNADPLPPRLLPSPSYVPSQVVRYPSGAFQTYSLASGTGNTITYWGAGPNSDLMDFLAADHIQKQIEFSKEQKDLIRGFQKRLGEEYMNIQKKFPELKKKDLPQKARQELNRTVHLKYMEVKKELNKELEESLVPQQLELVKKLKFRQTVQIYGLTWTLTNGKFKEEAKVTDKQTKEMQKIKRDTELAIQKKIAEMRKEAKEKLLKVLDRKQRDLLKDWEGDSKKGTIPNRL